MTAMNNRAYLSIGTNMGDREQNLHDAVGQLKNSSEIELEKVSKIYETQPVGGVKQDDFLNIAVEVDTSLDAHQLLDQLHKIEQSLHRKRLIHWGPRTIDLDILFFNQEHIDDAVLQVPHPEIANRRFVLIPMLEIAQDNTALQQQLKEMLAGTTDQNWVQEYQAKGEEN